jgi:hypothetical protein
VIHSDLLRDKHWGDHPRRPVFEEMAKLPEKRAKGAESQFECKLTARLLLFRIFSIPLIPPESDGRY